MKYSIIASLLSTIIVLPTLTEAIYLGAPSWSTCMYYYNDKSYCCDAAYNAPYSQCYWYWASWSTNAVAAPIVSAPAVDTTVPTTDPLYTGSSVDTTPTTKTSGKKVKRSRTARPVNTSDPTWTLAPPHDATL